MSKIITVVFCALAFAITVSADPIYLDKNWPSPYSFTWNHDGADLTRFEFILTRESDGWVYMDRDLTPAARSETITPPPGVTVATLRACNGPRPSGVCSDYVTPAQWLRVAPPPPYGICNVGLPAFDVPVTVQWLLAERGTLRTAGIATVAPGTPATCADMRINSTRLQTARWLYMTVRTEAGALVLTARATPTGAVCNADNDGDGAVTAADLGRMRTAFFANVCARGQCASDLDGDGTINTIDLGLLREAFGQTCVS